MTDQIQGIDLMKHADHHIAKLKRHLKYFSERRFFCLDPLRNDILCLARLHYASSLPDQGTEVEKFSAEFKFRQALGKPRAFDEPPFDRHWNFSENEIREKYHLFVLINTFDLLNREVIMKPGLFADIERTRAIHMDWPKILEELCPSRYKYVTGEKENIHYAVEDSLSSSDYDSSELTSSLR